MSVNRFWMVVDISETVKPFHNELIPSYKAPRFMHTTQGSAEQECLRLASKYPSGQFVILGAVGFARREQASWPGLTKRVAESVRIDDSFDFDFDDDIPF